jgi:NAD(P)-dependent dehydrogenase (short-subunit alcohol dehydrogenase family)
MSDLADRRILVTGATSGIGRVAALELGRRGADLILVCRDRSRGEALCAEIGPRAELVEADLASLASIRAAAAELSRRHDRLDVLVNNAGLLATTRRTSVDGFELTFAVNTLAPLLLTRLCEPLLRKAAPARVVMVSSVLHFAGVMAWDDLQLEHGFSARRAYAQSKLALNLLTRELARRLAPDVTVNAVHPGSISTDITRDLPWILRKLAPLVTRSAKTGARPLLRLAADPTLAGITGKYFDKLRERPHADAARDDAAAARLWQVANQLIGT